MYTNLRQLILILGIVLIASTSPGAFSLPLTNVSYAQNSTTEAISSNVIFQIASSQSLMHPSIPSGAAEKVIPASEPLGRLVAIPWKNLEPLDYQSIISQFLILPSYDELWFQKIAKSDDLRNITSKTIGYCDSPQETYWKDTLFRKYKAYGENGGYCSACHELLPAIATSNTPLDNEQSIRQQDYAEPVVDCKACHPDTFEDISWLSAVDG